MSNCRGLFVFILVSTSLFARLAAQPREKQNIAALINDAVPAQDRAETCSGSVANFSDDRTTLLQVSSQVRTRRTCPRQIEVTGVSQHWKGKAEMDDGIFDRMNAELNGRVIYCNGYNRCMHYVDEGSWMITEGLGNDGTVAAQKDVECPTDVPDGDWFIARTRVFQDTAWEQEKSIKVIVPDYDAKRMFDLLGRQIDADAAYHAVVKIGLGDKELTLEMSPRAVVSLVPTGRLDMVVGKDFTVFVADRSKGLSASCYPGHIYESEYLRLKHHITFGEYVKDLLGKDLPDWGPASYNCQAFAVDAIMTAAAHPTTMRTQLETLTHEASSLTEGSYVMGHEVAGVSKAWDALTGWLDIGLDEAEVKFSSLLDREIDSMRLYFFKSAAANVMTTPETRTRDFENRRAAMCNLEASKIKEDKATWEVASNDYDLKGRL